jgi:hypothetical protein
MAVVKEERKKGPQNPELLEWRARLLLWAGHLDAAAIESKQKRTLAQTRVAVEKVPLAVGAISGNGRVILLDIYTKIYIQIALNKKALLHWGQRVLRSFRLPRCFSACSSLITN